MIEAGDPGRTERLVVGVIGLGVMGRPMAAHLLRAGHTVRVTARRPEVADELVGSGAIWCATAAEVARGADVVLLMLPDLPEVEQLLAGPDGLLAGAGDLVLIIGSTSSATGVRALAGRLADQTDGRIRVIDAPVSGGEDGAIAGTLTIMVGGEPEPVRIAWPALTACGRPTHLGPLGSGQVAKACNQLVVAATVLALGEAAALAEHSGLDPAALFEVFAGGYADSRILATRGPRIAARDYAPSGPARYLIKDLGLADELADASQTRPVLLPTLLAGYRRLVPAGLSDLDMAVARELIERPDLAAPVPEPPVGAGPAE